ncbi:MAG TPA: hypothetical protein VGC65_11375 [Bacteroidia bacterium]
MKKYVLILFLLVGLSNVTFAQDRQKGSETISNKKWNKKMKKQRSHFEKRKKDNKQKDNGTSYRKEHKKYQVDGNGFAAVLPVKEDKKFMRNSFLQRKSYKRKLKDIMYARR